MTGRAGVEPIRVDCVGAGCDPCRTRIDGFSYNFGRYVGMCAMCGQWLDITADGQVEPHQRDDVLAMIERGDFG